MSTGERSIPLTVLLAGTASALADSMERALNSFPGLRFRVIHLEDVERAVELLASLRCELFALEVPDEPGRHGDILSLIRQAHPEVPLLALTTSAEPHPAVERLADEWVPRDLATHPLMAKLVLMLVRARAREAARGPEPVGRSLRRVLVVDDDDDARDAVRRVLQAAGGFLVYEAADGETALEIARRTRPDAILADVFMPRLNGFELCAAVRGDTSLKSVPVVLVTSYSSPADIHHGLELGASNYLVKPLNPERLPEQIERAIARPGPTELDALV